MAFRGGKWEKLDASVYTYSMQDLWREGRTFAAPWCGASCWGDNRKGFVFAATSRAISTYMIRYRVQPIQEMELAKRMRSSLAGSCAASSQWGRIRRPAGFSIAVCLKGYGIATRQHTILFGLSTIGFHLQSATKF